MKVFYPRNHYNEKNKKNLFPLVTFLEKGKKDINQNDVSYLGFQIIDSIEQADVVILPLPWNYYVKNGQKNIAFEFISKANDLGKKVYTFNGGDCGVKVPANLNIEIFRVCGFASKKNVQETAMPFFLTDPLMSFFSQDKIFRREISQKPTVGFCGQVNNSKINAISEMCKISIKNILFYLGLRKELPQKIQSSSYNRSKVLKKIGKSDKMESNFIWRKKYRAGAVTKEDRNRTTQEYYQNIIDSDYIVCMRGAGNFSVRLYETLAMGRIPIFINTDCMLPLVENIAWKEYMVWVEFNQLDKLEELVLTHYKKLNKEKLNKLFIKNREMWLNNMNMKDFFKQSITSTIS